IDKYEGLLVPELAGAIPIAPFPIAVVKIQSADPIELLATGRNRVLDHHVMIASTLDPQSDYQRVSGTHFAAERLNRPRRLVFGSFYYQPHVLARDAQV